MLIEYLLMQHAKVVCTTLTGVLMRDLRDLIFDVAVVDEAAQVLRLCTFKCKHLPSPILYHCAWIQPTA